MRKIPVVSSDAELNEVIREECARFGGEFTPEFFQDREDVLAFLKYELPEIKILYFSDEKTDCLGILSYDSVLRRDYPVVLGSLYLFTLIGLVAKLLTDLSYVLVDPRIQFEAAKR